MEAEKEHRIVKIGEMPKFRKGKDGFPTPYIEVGIPISCLQQIIIGHCQASDNNVKRVKALLCSKLLEFLLKSQLFRTETKYNKNENISLYINRNFRLNFKE